MYRRDPSAPCLALFSLALLLGLGSATAPAWSLDLGDLVGEAPGALLSHLGTVLVFWSDDSTAAAPNGVEGGEAGEGDAGVIIDPNGKPKP